MPDITCRIYIMWRGKASFPKFVHVISKWDCSVSSYTLFLLEYISWINLPKFTYISVHSLTNRHLKPDRMISHFVFTLELRSSTTRGSGIDRSTLSHARERTLSSPGQTNNTCWHCLPVLCRTVFMLCYQNYIACLVVDRFATQQGLKIRG